MGEGLPADGGECWCLLRFLQASGWAQGTSPRCRPLPLHVPLGPREHARRKKKKKK